MKVNVKQTWGIKSLLSALVIYLFVAIFINEEFGYYTKIPVFLLGVYIFATIALGVYFYKKDLEKIHSNSKIFKRNFPFAHLGQNVFHFEYVFSAANPNIVVLAAEAISTCLKEKVECLNPEKVIITDHDKNIKEKESKEFTINKTRKTNRGSNLTFVNHISNAGNMYSIQWWILLSGYIDKGSVISFLSFVPISLPFWIVQRINGDYNIAANLNSTYDAFYDNMALITKIKSANKLIINMLVQVLEEQGVDVSDLKEQQNQIMNIQISGGKANFGAIVQGAMNKVTKGSGATQ